jgi:hypothetical protein
MIVREIMVTQYVDRMQHMLSTDSTNFAGRWICHQISLSLAVVFLIKDAYSEWLLKFVFHVYFNARYFDWIMSNTRCYD